MNDPRMKIDFFRDPCHNYIPYTVDDAHQEVTEKDILESKWVQRLRRIFQLQCTWMVYPSAVHNRFCHVVGTMHLAGKFAAWLWESYRRNVGDDIPSKNHVVAVARLSGLLHDVGHGPMGHTLDEIYEKCGYNATHEDIGRKIIVEELGDLIRSLKRSPDGPFSEPIDPQTVADFVKLPSGRSYSAQWMVHFSKIITGLYSVDNLDYLMRDSYHCGTREYGTVDVDRFLFSTFITSDGLTLHKSSLSNLKAYLYSRFFMYENVYYHRTVRAFDFSFEELMIEAFPLVGVGNPLVDPEPFLNFDDHVFYSLARIWKNDPDEHRRDIAARMSALLNKDLLWRSAYEIEIFPHDPLSGLFAPKDIEHKLKELIYQELDPAIPLKIDIPFLTVRPDSYLGEGRKGVVIFDPLSESNTTMALAQLYHEIPFKFLLPRVYARREHFDTVRHTVPKALHKGGYDQKTSY
jgi:HD superfamily phosphohydrolase